jgi:7-carboxy-7-deazaguanine synthase
MSDSPRLRISEIFFSLQGESATVGYPTVFVRLTGCPLRCQYCDTEYAFKGGEWLSLPAILDKVAAYRTRYVTVTGGEPLAQQPCLALLENLCGAGYHVSLETSGALDVAAVDRRVIKVMDLKTPGSGEVQRNRYDNLQHLGSQDQVKFVICNREDYNWSVDMLKVHELPARCEILFSPSQGEQNATELADWILQDQLPVRLQIQLHKLLWGNTPGK